MLMFLPNFQTLIPLFSAKMEAQENDLPASVPFRISGFPTLKFKAAGTREFIDYEGDRSLESLTSFIEEHAKNPLTPVVVAEPAQVPLTTSNASSEHGAHDEL